MKIFSKSISLLLLISLSLLLCPSARAVDTDDEKDEDIEDIDEDLIVNDEGVAETQSTDLDDDDEPKSLGSPFVKANILFIQPESTDLPAGRLVKVLVGFHNNGTSDFIVDSIDGSFRYPQDFSYHIQNFSVFTYNKIVGSKKESTLEYAFTPSETFSSRQFGLTINLRYRSLVEDKMFVNSVFNGTVSIVEPDEGIDGETFFLYIFLAAIFVLVLVGLQQFFSVFTKKRRSTKASASYKLSNGGSSDGEIDYEWIPKEHLQTNKSPKPVQRTRRSVRNGGSAVSSGNSSNDE